MDTLRLEGSVQQGYAPCREELQDPEKQRAVGRNKTRIGAVLFRTLGLQPAFNVDRGEES